MQNNKLLGFLISLFFLTGFCALAQQKTWTLQQCIDTAIVNNITLKQAQLNNNTDAINLQQSKDNRYPNLILTDAPLTSFGNTTSAITDQSTRQSITSNGFAIGSSVTLFNGFQNLNTIKQNKFIYDADVQGVEKIKNDLILNVLTGYMQVLAYYEGVDIAQSQIKSTQTQVEQTNIYVQAGKLAELNLLQIQSELANDKLAKVNAENQLVLAKVTLMQLMNMPVDYHFEVVRPAITDSSLNPTALTSGDIYNYAENFLPEIKDAHLITQATETGLKVVQALYMPKLTMNGGIKTSGSSLAYKDYYQLGTIGFLQNNPTEFVAGSIPETELSNNFSNLWNQFNGNFSQYIGLTLTIPVFSNFVARNNVAIAKINVQNAQLNEETANLTLRKSIEQAYINLLATAQQYKAAEEALQSEARTFSDMEKKFNIGLTDATSFLIEKSNYTKAQQNVVQAKYNYLLQIKLVDFYIGKPITL